MMDRKQIDFDESDRNLFQVDDARLRADALKHSILPRLHAVMNECVSAIRRIYDIEVLDDSIVSYYPHFRPKRERELTLLYDSSYVALGGKRLPRWAGVKRKDGKPVKFLPFRLGLILTEDGLSLLMEHYWLKGLSNDSYEKLFQFHLDFEGLTHSLCYLSKMRPRLYFDATIAPIATFREMYLYMIRKRLFDNTFVSQGAEAYPISRAAIDTLVWRYALFFPIYDSYIRIAKAEPVRFLDLIAKANRWLMEDAEGGNSDSTEGRSSSREDVILRAKEAAETRVKVMPAIRWQVFQRDQWKCVSCGRGSQHDAILHVDHIIPRSKGGSDALDNYQTLCDVCNIGKGNRDNTDLRVK
ncbi:HNH endonuclease [uncultured Thiodictyon sp.]|uniref:HNH endonuclease n=1 Tax=uncultured Thiodictyon sp. TaxID=1846217 RepID=UPI0025CE5E8A|nr:HNH endonuclease [uncultured Thiodictyon sp.]